MDELLVHTKNLTPRQWAVDIIVAIVAFLVCCAQVYFASTTLIIRDEFFRGMIGYVTTIPPFLVFVALGLTTLPLMLRRMLPWPVFVATLLIFLGAQSLFPGYSLSFIGPLVALFTIGQMRPRSETIVAVVIGVIAMMFSTVPVESLGVSLFFRLQNITYLVVAALAGFAVRTHREYLAAAEARAEAAERSSEEEAVRRVAEERVRIARELHDITAHSLTAVSIQASAAERVIDRDPQAAKEAISNVRSTAKGALDEIRAMIGVLREDNDPETTPTQGTERMGDLAEYLERAGVSVTLDISGYHREAIPVYIDVALFGIAREAATNIVRHAQAQHARIYLASNAVRATLICEDDGVGLNTSRVEQKETKSTVPGHGLEGMAERTSLLKGRFTAVEREQGGTMIRADIPLGLPVTQ